MIRIAFHLIKRSRKGGNHGRRLAGKCISWNVASGVSPTVGAAGVGLAGFAIAATPVAGKVITTSTDNRLSPTARCSPAVSRFPSMKPGPRHREIPGSVVVIPEVFGMHEHIKYVTRRFARAGFLAVTFEPYAREGGVLNLPDLDAVRKVADPSLTPASWPTWMPSWLGQKNNPRLSPTGSG